MRPAGRGAAMRDMTILWALRSPCNLGCTYCYFGTIEEHRHTPPAQPGQLSHLSRGDVSLAGITAFFGTLADSAIRRVFIAGGEPLIWPPLFTVAKMIKEAGAEVVLCTNGIPLGRAEITRQIIALGVDGVSVSLDSADPAYNDRYRPARNGRHGWADVITGIRALLAARADLQAPKVGLYAAITRRNISALGEVARLAADLGADYYVPQPISLAPGHRLHAELSLRDGDVPALAAALDDLYESGLAVGLPERSYAHQFLSTVTAGTRIAPGCFGGHQLAFIEPDGSIWPCPSRHKIAATSPARGRNIRSHHAAELFSPQRRTSRADCALLSADCVSMWPLMGFDRFLHPADKP
jgi:MoaA/NifB/PqqE/SkfB family radical SAM enzyme